MSLFNISKKINKILKLNNNTKNTPCNIDNSWCDWFSGFVDGEGSFMVTSKMTLRFSVQLSVKDIGILKDIKFRLNTGHIYYYDAEKIRKNSYNYSNKVAYVVTHLVEIDRIVIPIFKNHPLKTEKRKDFEKWCVVCEMLRKNEHYSEEGFEKIISIKKTMNIRGHQPITII